MKSESTPHQLPNYGKLAMLYRISGAKELVVYSGTAEDCQKLYAVFQEWCNHTADLTLHETDIRCQNPMLAWHLQEVVKYQAIVPVQNDAPNTDIAGSMII